MKKTINQENADIYESGFVGEHTYIRRFKLAKGEKKDGHSHYIDHTGNLVSGAARITWHHETDLMRHGVIDLLVPAKVDIRADCWHEIEALEDSVWECWFSAHEAERVYGVEQAKAVNWHLEKPVAEVV